MGGGLGKGAVITEIRDTLRHSGVITGTDTNRDATGNSSIHVPTVQRQRGSNKGLEFRKDKPH